jgi:purine-nucleoside phosphorylase
MPTLPSNSTVGQFTMRQYDEAADAILGQTAHRPTVGLILGSGLSPLAEAVEEATVLPYAELPHFPTSTVAGHAGRLVIGMLGGVTVCVMQGRFHAYEGYSLAQTVFPVRVMQRMGVRTLILTNAAGGVNPNFAVGDLMLIEDHINFAGMAGFNPLIGPNLDEFGPRFPAMNHTYTRRLRELASSVGADFALPLRRGVYTYLSGPFFETPAEVRMLRGLGTDAVGMSTVPEALVATHAGMDVLAISTITNICIDELDADGAPSHEEVQEAGKIIVPRLMQMLLGVLTRLPEL